VSIFLETDTNPAFANTKLGAVAQHGGPHAFFVVKRSIGGVKVLQIYDFVPHFQQAMVPGNLGIVQRNVRAFPSDDDARLRQPEDLAVRWTGCDRQHKYAIRWKLQTIVCRGQPQIGTGGVSASKRRQWADDHRLVRAPLDLDNRSLPALRALKLHFRMDGGVRILELVLGSAMNARSLHPLILHRRRRGAAFSSSPCCKGTFAASAKQAPEGPEAACPPPVLRLGIPNQAGERSCPNIFRVKN
jgi:hypothetical protein